MKDKINVKIEGKSVLLDKGLQVIDVFKKYDLNNSMLGLKLNNEISSYTDKIDDGMSIDFLYVNDTAGNKIYKSALKFILIVAVHELYGGDCEVFFEHSIDKGICFKIETQNLIEEHDLQTILLKMQEIVDNNHLFKKVVVTKKDAIEYFNLINEKEKALNIQNISNNVITLYNLMGYYNYFYTAMPYSTKCIKEFNVVKIDVNKFVLLFPVEQLDYKVPSYTHYPLNMKAFTDYKEWIKSMNVINVSDVNYMVAHNKIEDFIRTNELYLQKNILNEAEKINERDNIRIVLIAGPSSSGKTTTSKKLSLALRTYGKKILSISIDDYYINQSKMPKSVVKKRDFESIDLIDLELLNLHISKLLNNEEVILPTYDFTTGIKEFNSKPLTIDNNTIIILEGIHALNTKLLNCIDESKLYKMYISPFEPLSLDRHNHLSTIDLRLIRRLVRDSKYRGVSVETTILSWPNVRKGEEKYIFPYMKNVDSVLNTSLIYEIGALKIYAEPLLYSVPVTSNAYEEARRLIEFLKLFYPIPSDYIEKNSLLREFIGGSIFK